MQQVLPNALAIGVEYDTFWKGNPLILDAYFKAFKLRQEREAKLLDQQAWAHGAYVRQALVSAMPKGPKYPEQPYSVKEAEMEREAEASGVSKDYARFKALVERHNRNWRAKHGEGEMSFVGDKL